MLLNTILTAVLVSRIPPQLVETRGLVAGTENTAFARVGEGAEGEPGLLQLRAAKDLCHLVWAS